MSQEQNIEKKINKTSGINSGITEGHIIKIAQCLSESLCVNVIAYDVKAVYDYMDFSIIATTTSDIHRRGVIDTLTDFFYKNDLPYYAKLSSLRIKRQQQGGWILVDYYDFLIHLMDDDTREFYNFEQLLSKTNVVYTTCET